MKIVAIFDTRLFSFHYQGEEENEYKRLLNQWTDTIHIRDFVNKHWQDDPKKQSIAQLRVEIIEDAFDLDDDLNALGSDTKANFDPFFKQLDNKEYRITELSKRKGRKNYLRLYAIRIDKNCFVITGGAIKFTHYMDDREHTKAERIKLEKCREYLKGKGVFDSDSFYAFLREEL